jgi:hypothetical protein
MWSRRFVMSGNADARGAFRDYVPARSAVNRDNPPRKPCSGAEQSGTSAVQVAPLRLRLQFWKDLMLASRNLLVALVVVLVAGLAATGYALYQEKKQPEGVEISVGKNGLSIKEK